MVDKPALFSRRGCGLPSVFDQRAPEEALSAVLKELMTECVASTPYNLVVDLSENNLTLDHVRYLASWLCKEDLYRYALDLSLNRIYAAEWDDILPSIRKLLPHVERLHLGGNYLPALHNIPALQELQRRKVAFLGPRHSFNSNVWIEAWKSNARNFNRDAYGGVKTHRLHGSSVCIYTLIFVCREEESDSD